MEEAEEATAEAEAQGGRVLRLVEERRVVEPQLLERVAQLRVLVGVHGVEPREHHRLDLLEAGQRLLRRLAVVGERVADRDVGHAPDPGDHEPDLAGRERVDGHGLRREDAELLDLVGAAGRHQAHLHARLEPPVDDVDEHDDAAVLVEPRVEHEAAERPVRLPVRRRNPVDDRLEDLVDPDADLRGGEDRARGVDPDDLLDLLPGPVRLRRRKVDLVDDGDDLEPGVGGEVGVRERLRLDPLARVDDEECPLAGGERAAHLVGEVDVARRVDQVEDVVLPVLRLVLQAHRVLLDGDAPLALEVHRVEELLGHLALAERAGALHQAVGERRLAVVDVRDDREVPDSALHGLWSAPAPAQQTFILAIPPVWTSPTPAPAPAGPAPRDAPGSDEVSAAARSLLSEGLGGRTWPKTCQRALRRMAKCRGSVHECPLWPRCFCPLSSAPRLLPLTSAGGCSRT